MNSKPRNARHWPLCLLPLFVAVVFSSGCASTSSASYHYSQKQLEHGAIDFHRTLRVDEYLNAFPQDDVVVPEAASIALRVTPFTRVQPMASDRSLIQIAVKTRKPTAQEQRQSISLCLVVDISGSMQADSKMKDTSAALANSITELRDGDELAIVVFNNVASVLFEPQPLNQNSRSRALDLVRQLAANGGTNIEDGLVVGYREMSRFTGQGARRLVLITDGRSNVGVRAPAELAKKAAVEYLENQRISTVGLGIDVDEVVLRDIAAEGRGHYYFAENGKALTTILRDELVSTVIPVVRDVRLMVAATPGFKLINVYGASKNARASDGSVTLEFGELNVDDWRIVLAELEGHVAPGSVVPLQAELRYTEIGAEPRALAANAAVEWHTAAKPSKADVNVLVARNSVLFGNAQALVELGELAERNEFGKALEIVDLQIINNRLLEAQAPVLSKEIERLENIRRILVQRAEASAEKPAASIGSVPITKPQQHASTPQQLIASALKLAATSLPGVWATLAGLLAIFAE